MDYLENLLLLIREGSIDTNYFNEKIVEYFDDQRIISLPSNNLQLIKELVSYGLDLDQLVKAPFIRDKIKLKVAMAIHSNCPDVLQWFILEHDLNLEEEYFSCCLTKYARKPSRKFIDVLLCHGIKIDKHFLKYCMCTNDEHIINVLANYGVSDYIMIRIFLELQNPRSPMGKYLYERIRNNPETIMDTETFDVGNTDNTNFLLRFLSCFHESELIWEYDGAKDFDLIVKTGLLEKENDKYLSFVIFKNLPTIFWNIGKHMVSTKIILNY